MTEAIEKLLRDQCTELLAQNVSSMAEELKTSSGAKLTVNMGFKLCLAGTRIYVQSGVSFSRKYADSAEGMVELPDPSQPGLPLEDNKSEPEEIKFATGGGHISVRDAKEIVKAVKGRKGI